MLSLAVQVSVNPTGYLGNKKTKHKQYRESYFRDYYQKHREKLLTKKSLLWSNYFICKKPWCSTCIQAGIKETEYKFCGENCSVKYWLTIYSEIGKKEKEREKVNKKRRNVEQFSPHTRNDILNSVCVPADRLRALHKNVCFFFAAKNQQERQKRKDQAWRRLATKNKIAQVSGYNLPTYKEKRSIEELLKKHGEFSYLTGKPLGNYYLSTLDIDLRKIEFPEKMIVRLEKNTDCLLNSLRVSYDKTKKGLHVDILTPELLPNETIYYHGWGKSWNVGSIQSKGKYVVGEDKDKEFVKNEKWYWKVKRNEEVKEKLAEFFLMVGKRQEVANDTPELVANTKTKKVVNKSTLTQIQAKILSVKKTCLTDLSKVFYWNQRSQRRGYFLLNTYQKPNILPNLSIGSTRSMLLVNGRKHNFFGRMDKSSFAGMVYP